MKQQCAFTIVAKNYIGLGLILGQSLHEQNPDVDFFIFVADDIDDLRASVPPAVVSVRDVAGYSDAEWTDMAFKYDLTEFCTAVKPACFQHAMALGYGKAVYFDPDVYVFSSVSRVFSVLDDYDVALTPQVAGLHVDYQGEHPEWAMNVNGVFNLGFCAMRRSPLTADVLSWWRQRLKDNCFADRSVGNFTDQKWMDWMPALLGTDHLYVFHDLGMNMAPWNFFERRLYRADDGQLMVTWRTADNTRRDDPLVFLHFAGYDYQQLKQGVVSRKRIVDLQEYDDLQLATNVYRDAIIGQRDVFDRFIAQPYSYAEYADGQPIDRFHRRLYHGLTLQGHYVADPFATGRSTLHEQLCRRGMVGGSGKRVDSINRRNIGDIGRKRRLIGRLFAALYRVMGYRRYVLFVKSLYDYCRPEFHTFLIGR